MSALHIARLFLLIAIMSTVVSTYAVLPSGMFKNVNSGVVFS